MKIQQIKEKLQSEEYDFLRNNPILNNNIILLTLGGSFSYGTSNENSDIDLRGIALNSAEEILTMNYREKPFESRDDEKDVVIYFISQIVKLLANCNPNVLEMMGTTQEQLFILTDVGKLLRDNVNIFLSKKVIHAFGGYATSQLRRLQNALARDSYPQQEKERHILKSIENQMVSFEDKYEDLTGQEIKLYLDKSDKTDFEEEIFIDFNIKHYPLRDFKNIYSEMANVVKDYSSLNHRNNKKDEEHLLKHGMHLIRLLIMGSEILEGKGINTYRVNDREFLLDIRNGKYSYEEIFKFVDDFEARFKYAADNTNLPDKPDYDKINDLVIEINRGVVNAY